MSDDALTMNARKPRWPGDTGRIARPGRCPKCGGNLLFETDILEALLLRKCLQCGLIESYFWLERSTSTLVQLPVEDDLALAGDGI